MLANAPSMPKQAGTTPATERVGERTQLDGWTSGTTSLLGNKGMTGVLDAHSHWLRVYPLRLKSEQPDHIRKYYKELKLHGHAGGGSCRGCVRP